MCAHHAWRKKIFKAQLKVIYGIGIDHTNNKINRQNRLRQKNTRDFNVENPKSRKNHGTLTVPKNFTPYVSIQVGKSSQDISLRILEYQDNNLDNKASPKTRWIEQQQ